MKDRGLRDESSSPTPQRERMVLTSSKDQGNSSSGKGAGIVDID